MKSTYKGDTNVPRLEKDDLQKPSPDELTGHRKQPSQVMGHDGLGKDLISCPYHPLSAGGAVAPTLKDKSKDEKLPSHIADLEETDSVLNDSDFSLSESDLDIPTPEDKFKEIARKALESVIA